MFHQFRAGQIRVPVIRFEVFTGALFQLIVVAVQGIEALQKCFFPIKNLHMAFVAVGTDDLVQIRSAVLDLFLVFGARGVACDLLTAERAASIIRLDFSCVIYISYPISSFPFFASMASYTALSTGFCITIMIKPTAARQPADSLLRRQP